MAHAEGKTVAAHAHGAPSIRNAVLGGVDTVEHASFLTEELIGEMLERGTFIVPTLAVIKIVIEAAGDALGAETVERAHEVAAAHRENIIAAWRAGVPLAAGTDMGSPFTGPDALHDEIAQLAGLGMTAHEAIQAATLQGARVLGLEDDLGTVRPGRRADLLVLDGDPLADLGATRRIRHLLQDGELAHPRRRAGRSVGAGRPRWLPRGDPTGSQDELYPFESRYFETPDGQRMHYVDEGAGAPIVFVHGNPSWSFEFRRLIEGLRGHFRCIAPDHIGFGLSSRSDRREDHHPAAHAERFAALLDHLAVRDATLFMGDWGGPIGLEFARRHPERVARLVIANTWCWPVDGRSALPDVQLHDAQPAGAAPHQALQLLREPGGRRGPSATGRSSRPR